MTKRERKANQRANRRLRHFFSRCRRISRESMREAIWQERQRAVDAALADVRLPAGSGG